MTALAKKSTSKKAPRKTTAKKAAASKPAAQKPRQSTKSKANASKATGAKKTAKKAARKPTAKKTPAKKTDTQKTSTKKATGGAKASAKKASKKKARESTASKKQAAAEQKPDNQPGEATKPAAKPGAKKTAGKAGEKKTSAKQSRQGGQDEKKADAGSEKGSEKGSDKKSGRKGITIVEPAKKSSSKGKAQSKYNPPVRPMLLGPGSTFTKPLIPSGPSAPKITSVFDSPKSRRTKSPFSKSKLEKFRSLLIAKRAELLGDVESMENEALRSGSGGLSNTPQHLAEQGSESYDQSLSLNLAAQDRRLIKEIDEALKRIEDGTYGLCELTNQPIAEDRLEELPWARYTIEAARQLESRGSRP